MKLEYKELAYQMEGLRSSLSKMEHGMKSDDVRYIKAEMSYLKEKFERVQSEAQYVLDNSQNNWVPHKRGLFLNKIIRGEWNESK